MFFKSSEFYFLLTISVITILLHACNFFLPPLWADETSPFVMAISLISSHNSDLYHYSMQWGAHLEQFPVAWQHYNGNILATYLTVPFLYFIGVNVTTVRIYELVVAIAVLVLTYYCGKEIFSKNTGMIGALLLSILPSFVFYSRQSSLYDWIDLCVALLLIIFGIRYLKYKKTLYLFGSLFLVGVGVYEYLWFVWIVIGLLVTIPFWIKKIKFDKKFVITSSTALILGFSHLIIGYVLSPTQSPMSFAVGVLLGNNSEYPHASNANFLGNAMMRSNDLFGFLSKPGIAFLFYNSSSHFDVTNYAFSIIFAITTIFLILYIYKRKQGSRQIGSILILILGIFVASMFTISEFLPIQISIILPFLFLSIGRGLDIILSKIRNKITMNYLMLIAIVLIGSTQITTLISGFDVMGSSSTAQTDQVYNKINSYVFQHHLQPVSLDFFTAKVMPFYSDGKIIPVVMRWTLPQSDELNKFREPMQEINSLDLRSNYIFLAYSYPNFPNCLQPTFEQKPVCDDLDYIKTYAEKNSLKIQKTSFSLPDGTSFITGVELKR